MVRISETFAKDETPVDWEKLKREILDRLNVMEEYEALGVQFADGVISIKGWRNCHAIDRVDAKESAAVNVRSWIYHDRGGEGKSLNFFDFALKYGNWGTWVDVVRHFAEKAGIEVGAIKRTSRGGIEEAVYHYQDADGTVRYGVFRYRLPNGKKDFRQYPLVNGEWVKERNCMDGVQPLPYRLPDLLASADDEPILCVEGEKDVERAYAEKFIATTSQQGAGSTDKTWGLFAQNLPRRDYFVIPDRDVNGRAHAQRVCAHLHPFARSVRYLSLPGLPQGGDLSDWFDLGGTTEELGQLMAAAPLWTPEKAEEIAQADAAQALDAYDQDATAADLIAINATIRWIIPGWVPVGVLTGLAAEPGCGKTRLCGDLLKTVWLGLPTWPDGTPNTLPPGGKALWVAADNQHPELGSFPGEFGFAPEALILNTSKLNPFGGTMLDSAEDLADFERRILRVKPVFVFIDTSLNATDRSSNKPEDAKAFFKPLQEIAARTQTAIICVTHLNADGKPLGRRIQGQCRVVISMSNPDPENQPNRRALWVSKSNSLYPPALGVTLERQGNTYDFFPPKAPAEGAGKGKPQITAKVKACCDWLRDTFRGSPALMVREIRAAAEANDISASTLYKAKDVLGIVEEEIGNRKWWRNPDPDDDEPTGPGVPADKDLAF